MSDQDKGILDHKDLKLVFAKFLQSKDLWNEFFSEVNAADDMDHGGSLDELFSGRNARHWLEDAFAWNVSPSEWDIWDKVDDEWKEICSLNEKS